MRGNPGWHGHILAFSRSIPARAGEPPPYWKFIQPRTVYPRACGGTWRILRRTLLRWGLSPRVRGNHYDNAPEVTQSRSIPARAGEPGRSFRVAPTCKVYPRACGEPKIFFVPPGDGWVYPRACGGTLLADNNTSTEEGLSPRVRGTTGPISAIKRMPGLSPRVRGNLQRCSGS